MLFIVVFRLFGVRTGLQAQAAGPFRETVHLATVLVELHPRAEGLPATVLRAPAGDSGTVDAVELLLVQVVRHGRDEAGSAPRARQLASEVLLQMPPCTASLQAPRARDDPLKQ